MPRLLMLLPLLITVPACEDESSLCYGVTCSESEVCSESDGECHCQSEDGPVCSDDETCEDDSGSCILTACLDVTCDVDGTLCGSDGLCHCGSTEGPVCDEDEACHNDSETCTPTVCEGVVCEVEGAQCASDGLCHCGDEIGPVCTQYETCEEATATCEPFIPEPRCTDGTRWVAGTQVFREVTDDWGLTGVQGTRLNLADIDGDGYVDLLVRHGIQLIDEFTEDGIRSTYLLRNDGHRFIDVTLDSGLLTMRNDESGHIGRPNSIAAFADVDNDGDIDAFTGLDVYDEALSLGEWSELMLNDGAGNFSFATEERADNFRSVGSPAGAAFVDANRDGNVDIWIPQANARGYPLQDRLFIGNGEGQFTEETSDSLLLTRDWGSIDDLNAGLAHTNSWGAAACDLNGDGTPELLSPSYGRAPNHLWQGERDANGNVTFVNRSVDSGYAFDDNYTWHDNHNAACYCQSAPEAEGCEEVIDPMILCSGNWDHDTDREPFRLGGNSASTFCADVDNDGDIDLLTGEIKHWWAGSGSDGSELLVNSGDYEVRFDRPGDEATGLVADHLGRTDWDEGHMTNAVFDFDNDGWLDVYIGASEYPGNRGLLYHQESPLSFVELSTDDFFEHNRSQGVVFADVDRDGDLDIIVGHSRSRGDATEPNNIYETMQVRLFENVMDEGNWLQLHLVGGEGSNRSAIGARVTVAAGGVTQTREVEGGFGHFGCQNDMVLHFGLGAECEAEVTVRWPDADLTEEIITLPSGYRFELTQGDIDTPRVVP